MRYGAFTLLRPSELNGIASQTIQFTYVVSYFATAIVSNIFTQRQQAIYLKSNVTLHLASLYFVHINHPFLNSAQFFFFYRVTGN